MIFKEIVGGRERVTTDAFTRRHAMIFRLDSCIIDKKKYVFLVNFVCDVRSVLSLICVCCTTCDDF